MTMNSRAAKAYSEMIDTENRTRDLWESRFLDSIQHKNRHLLERPSPATDSSVEFASLPTISRVPRHNHTARPRRQYTKEYTSYRRSRARSHIDASYPINRQAWEGEKTHGYFTVDTTVEKPTMHFRADVYQGQELGNWVPYEEKQNKGHFPTTKSWVSYQQLEAKCEADQYLTNPSLRGRSHVPGYSGHVQTEQFEYGRSFGNICRDVLHFDSGLQLRDYREFFNR